MEQKRALVSLIMPIYRNQPYLRDAIQSVFAQDYHPLEIIIQDDASPDDAFEIVKQMAEEYNGPHTIKIGKNKTNRAMENYNVMMRKASGHYIVVAHDDDIQNPDRVSRIMDAFEAYNVSMVSSNSVRISADGAGLGPNHEMPEHQLRPQDYAEFGWSPQTHGASFAWTKDVFDSFGPLKNLSSPNVSDWVLPFRASLLRGIHYIQTPLLQRRVHVKSRGAIGSTTDDIDIYRVERFSESIVQFTYLRATADTALENKLISKKLHNDLVEKIDKQLVASARIFSHHRNRLLKRKQRVSWVPADGGVTQADMPNLGVNDANLDLFINGGRMHKFPKGLKTRPNVIAAIKGSPWYVIAFKKPHRIHYWWTVRWLQAKFKYAAREKINA